MRGTNFGSKNRHNSKDPGSPFKLVDEYFNGKFPSDRIIVDKYLGRPFGLWKLFHGSGGGVRFYMMKCSSLKFIFKLSNTSEVVDSR